MDARDVGDWGLSDFARYKAMQDWHNHEGQMLAYVSDVLRPVSFDEIVQNDFAALKAMLARAGEHPGKPSRG